jgi:hypothetical protein
MLLEMLRRETENKIKISFVQNELGQMNVAT